MGLEPITNNELASEAGRLFELLGLPAIPICWNNRLRTTGGIFRRKGPECSIEINPKYLDRFGTEVAVGILRHEMAHYALFYRGKSHNHTREFKTLCQSLGGLMNGSMAGKRFKDSASDKFIRSPRKYLYSCPGCGLTVKMARRRNIKSRRWKKGRCATCKTPARKFAEARLTPQSAG